jgi:hypothetical protein
MDLNQLFLQRYRVLCDIYLADIWETVPYDLMRRRPHPGVNSIAWNLWHISRAEDAGLNRFVVDLPQILFEGGWMERMNIPWRHHGSEMTFAEVDELDERIDIQALREYSKAVQNRTLEILAQIQQVNLDELLQEERVRSIIVEEGLAHSEPEGFIKNYTGWSKGKCLLMFGMTHPFQHVGEIGVIASLLGVVFP